MGVSGILKENNMKVQAIKCKLCGETIYSRARHDFKWCSCHTIFIDGGFDYMRCGGEPENIESVEVDIGPVTVLELYKDWNEGIDRFGRITG